jgi:hypothetical protein
MTVSRGGSIIRWFRQIWLQTEYEIKIFKLLQWLSLASGKAWGHGLLLYLKPCVIYSSVWYPLGTHQVKEGGGFEKRECCKSVKHWAERKF